MVIVYIIEDIVYTDNIIFEDVLNLLIIISKAFNDRADIIFNPRNAMYISRINGKINKDVLVQRDTLINANTLMHLGRENYTKAELDKINKLKKKAAV